MSATAPSGTALYDYEPRTGTLREDVLRGLSGKPKWLPSQYLYDERGARLFERICETPEYYLTRAEIAILRGNMAAIAARIGPGALVVEPGSGNGVKTRMLLESLEDPAGYVPIDVAKRQLVEFAAQMRGEFPNLAVMPMCADFTGDYTLPPCPCPVRKRVTYFPGSTIGNFKPRDAVRVLRHMAGLCSSAGASPSRGGGVLIGVDLKKDRSILEPAYDDAEGVSRDFALNYLVRLNRELGADFRVDRFGYEAPYNEVEGRIEMALVSRSRQVARVGGIAVALAENERVRTEFSYKYDPGEFATLAAKAALRVVEVWTDPQRLFSVQYLEPCSGIGAARHA